MLSRRAENKHLYLVPDLRGKAFSLSLLSTMSAAGFFVNVLYQLKKFPSVPAFLGVFTVEGCQILSNAFPASIVFTWFLFLLLLTRYIVLPDIRMLSQLCIPGTHPTGHSVWFFVCVAGVQRRAFASGSHRVSVGSVLVTSFSGLVSRWHQPSRSIPSSFILWKSLWRIGFISSLNIW